MYKALLIGLPQAVARRFEGLLAGLDIGRLDASSLSEAADLLRAMPVLLVAIHAKAGPAEVVKALSLLPLTSSHRVLVLHDTPEQGRHLEAFASEQISCHPTDFSDQAMKAILRQIRSRQKADHTVQQFGAMLGDCQAMREVYTLIAKVAPTDAAVLICGESGTGKELVAQAIHQRSERKDAPFVAVNCGAIAENLIESELFGHEKGAFTGAQKAHPGVFEQADGGTLFLDEITEMPIEMQVRLLRVLETGQIRRLGSEQEIEVDVRVVAATNRNPQDAVNDGHFREDLMFRLAVFPITLPPLRQRSDDVMLIARHFLSEHNKDNGTTKRLTSDAERRLLAYDWPGNVRQLRNIIHRSFIIEGETIALDCLVGLMEGADPVSCDAAINTSPDKQTCDDEHAGEQTATATAADDPPGPSSIAEHIEITVGTTIDEAEKQLILKTMQELKGDKPEVARVLGISLKTLYNRLNNYEAQET